MRSGAAAVALSEPHPIGAGGIPASDPLDSQDSLDRPAPARGIVLGAAAGMLFWLALAVVARAAWIWLAG